MELDGRMIARDRENRKKQRKRRAEEDGLEGRWPGALRSTKRAGSTLRHGIGSTDKPFLE